MIYLILLGLSLFTQGATLEFEFENAPTKTFSTEELLKRKDIETISLEKDPVYPEKKIKYKALKLNSLLQELKIPKTATFIFRCQDGFSAPLSLKLLMENSPQKSIAYLAIEPNSDKWPRLSKDKASAGPFYLIWKDPKKSKISSEQWPFMLKGFSVKKIPLRTLYSKIAPSLEQTKKESIHKGFDLFLKNCFACHTINKVGESELGPDLNYPMSPLEYLGEKNLRKLVRDPSSLRYWPQSKMSGFSSEDLSEEELTHIISYLNYMRRFKKLK